MSDRAPGTRLAAVLVTLALAGCGSTSGPSGPEPGGPSSASATSPSPPASPGMSPSPSAGPGNEKNEVVATTERFWAQAAKVGYPEKTFDAYADRVRPLMTVHGYDDFIRPADRQQFAKQAEAFYAERRRVVPHVEGSVRVVSVGADRARTRFSFRNEPQQLADGVWKTGKRLPTETTTLTLVRQDGAWLVDGAES